VYRTLVALMAIPMRLGAAGLTIDHVTVAGKDLRQMRAALDSIGIGSEYGGPHSNRATEMALTSFPDGSYIELIAPQAKADPQALAAHYWAKYMNGGAGPTAWAARTQDIAAEVRRLQSTGVEVRAPARSGRTRPDGVRLEWESAQVGDEPNGTFFPFLVHDFTPREARAFPTGPPTTKGLSGLKIIVIAVRDLNESIARYRAAYGLPASEQQVDTKFGARLARLPGTPVVLATPIGLHSWVAARLAQFGEGPCAFVLGRSEGKKSGTKYRTASRSTWFGSRISWFDAAKLGWHLGLED